MPKITFKTNYRTQWGECIAVTGNIAELGKGDVSAALKLDYTSDGNWEKSIEVDADSFEYQYVLINENGEEINREWGEYRSFSLKNEAEEKRSDIALKDAWRAKYRNENALYNSAFLKVIFNPKTYKSPFPKAKKSASQPTIRFQIHAPRVKEGQRLCILGNVPALGNWGNGKPLLLGNEDYPLWSGSISFVAGMNIEYKYGIYDTKAKEVIYWEKGNNRQLSSEQTKDHALTVVHDLYFNHPKGDWKGTGMAIPVFSLRTENGLGIGEFTDIKLFVDWAKQVGMKMAQILPINDTSARGNWIDSYPYAAISVFALHPMYLNIEAIDGFKKVIDKKEYQELQLQLNALEVVDYEQVNENKLRFARQIFDATKSKVLKSKSFKEFFEGSEHWLKSYAFFCVLRDQHGTANFNEWGENSVFSEEKMEQACSEKSDYYNDIAFYYFLQYNLDQQLQDAGQYARKNNIVLKGDIPIGIYRHSVDAWTQPHLYHMDAQAGAPPDQFSDAGQNWGFPTYNWDVMAQDGYAWWKNRFKVLSKYFDAFRIDHILGFFRIWQVPYHSTQAKLGYFYPAIPVTISELYQRGIGFDYDRLCKPFITHEHLLELFGDQADYVTHTFLQPSVGNRFAFQEAFDTQRKIENYFESGANDGQAHLMDGLLKLHGEVLFIEEMHSEKQAFHPRFGFQSTRSFKYFPEHIRHNLELLYRDYYFNRQEELWTESAMTKLPSMKAATDMLICAEDLGMIPDCVPGVLKELDLLTLEIQSMSKNPNTEFLQAADVPYLSVCSPSTHDSQPIRLWWKQEERPYIQRFYNNELHHWGEAPTTCPPELVQQILQQHLDFPSMWAVFPLSDILGMSEKLQHPNPEKERINQPDVIPHYWQYRMHLTMEELMEEKEFGEKWKEMLKRSGRA